MGFGVKNNEGLFRSSKLVKGTQENNLEFDPKIL